jgi:hypothetical protein
MTDDNVIGIDGRQAVQLREDQAQREKQEEILRQKLKIVGFELQPGNAPGTYTIAHPHPRNHRTLMDGATYHSIK